MSDNEQMPTEAERYRKELLEIAGMVAQSPDGPLRWKQYRLTAIADFIGTEPRTTKAGEVTVTQENRGDRLLRLNGEHSEAISDDDLAWWLEQDGRHVPSWALRVAADRLRHAFARGEQRGIERAALQELARDFRWRAQQCLTSPDAYCERSGGVWNLAADAVEAKL